MRVRIFLTVLAIVLYVGSILFMFTAGNAQRSQAAANQLSSDHTAAAQAQASAELDPVFLATSVFMLVMLGVWGEWLIRHKRQLPLLGLAVLLGACGSKTDIKTIEANQTAFLVSITGDPSSQSKFASVDFLKDKQVAAKQIEIPYDWKQTGTSMGFIPTGDWYPSVKLYVVDRSLVTREWTDSDATGSTPSNQAFAVESKESIGFQIGATCTALIKEEDAATYLYWFGEKPLGEIMDENVRGVIQKELFSSFGSLDLEGAQAQKNSIFTALEAKLITEFKEQGVTIVSCGGQGGLAYDEQTIQDSINKSYVNQQAIIQQEAQATQQGYINQQMVSAANAAATATVIAGGAQAEVMRENGEMIDKYPGLTGWTLANKSVGSVPQVLVLGSGQSGQLPFSMLLPAPGATPAPTAAPSN